MQAAGTLSRRFVCGFMHVHLAKCVCSKVHGLRGCVRRWFQEDWLCIPCLANRSWSLSIDCPQTISLCTPKCAIVATINLGSTWPGGWCIVAYLGGLGLKCGNGFPLVLLFASALAPLFVYSPPCFGVSVVYIADVCDVLSLLPLLLLLLRFGLLIQIARYDCAVEHSLS